MRLALSKEALKISGRLSSAAIVLQGPGDGQGKLGGLDDARPGDHDQVAGAYPKVCDRDRVFHGLNSDSFSPFTTIRFF